MNLTVKETASELGISEQYVRKLIKNLPASAQPTKLKGAWSINEQALKALSNALSSIRTSSAPGSNTSSANTKKDSSKTRDSKDETSSVDKALDVLQEQLQEKDRQIAELHKALDQEQQLHLSSKQENAKLVAQLEARLELKEPLNPDTPSDETSSASSSEYTKKPVTPSKKRGLFHWFKKD